MVDFGVSLNQLLGEKIKSHRLSLGLNQEDVAKQVGLGRASISNIEVGRHQVSIAMLYHLAKVFKTEVHFLLPTYDEIDKAMSSKDESFEEVLRQIHINENARLSIHNILKTL